MYNIREERQRPESQFQRIYIGKVQAEKPIATRASKTQITLNTRSDKQLQLQLLIQLKSKIKLST